MTQLDLIIQFCNDANERNCLDKILYIKQATERAKADHAVEIDHAIWQVKDCEATLGAYRNEIEEAWAAFGFTSNREVLNLAEQIHVTLAELETEVEVIAESVGQQIEASFSIETLRAALDRQCDSMAFILNHMAIPVAYYEKFTRELEEDRAALAPPIIRVEGETQ